MYKYEFKNGHCVVNIDGKNWLLDTGSPASFAFDGSMDKIMIDAYAITLGHNPGYKQNVVEKVVGTDIFGMIGSDIINKTSLTIYIDGRIDFNLSNINSNPILVNIDKNVITGDIFVGGKEIKVLFDTGACINYLKPNTCDCYDLHKVFIDYDKDGNKFNSKAVMSDVRLVNRDFNISFGIPVDRNCSPMFYMGYLNASAIIGLYDYHQNKPIFSKYFAIDGINKKIYIE